MPTDSPAVSIIVPTYNRARFVTRAIDSVLAQSYRDYELIVVDDGSTDDTATALSSYEQTVRYLRLDRNRGVAAARNEGLRIARGEWIAFLDSDDTWLPEKLARQMELLAQGRAQVCFTHALEQRPAGTYTPNFPLDTNRSLVTDPLGLVVKYHIFTPTLVVARALLEAVGGFDTTLRIGEDTDLQFRLAVQTPTFAYVSMPLVLVERTDEREGLIRDATYTTWRKKVFAASAVLLRAYSRCNGQPEADIQALRTVLGTHLYNKAFILSLERRDPEARRTARDAAHFSTQAMTRLKCLAICIAPRLARWKARPVPHSPVANPGPRPPSHAVQ